MNDEFIETLNRFTETYGQRAIEDFVRFTKESGLSMPQINVLLHLYYIDSCEITGIKKYISGNFVAASQIIDRLVERGLVERKLNPDDRRVRLAQLTETGREMVKASILARRQWIGDISLKFNSQEQALIIQAINLLIGRSDHEHVSPTNTYFTT